MTQKLGCNVLEAARRRIDDILDRYDSVVVAFSGGKDSLVTLHLLREQLQARDPHAKVNVIFRDEELIPDVVINFVDSYRQRPWVNMKWFTVPLASSKFVLGRVYDYIQWDPARDWVRPKPAWGINDPDGKVYDQYTMDGRVAQDFPGKVCVLTGIRCQESITRYRAIINKRGNPEVAATQEKRLHLGRPIYDWSEDDIFRYLWERQIPYCPIYDWQSAAGHNLRVSTPLHAEQAKRLDQLREVDPVFFDRVLRLFPEVAVQGRYYREYEAPRPQTVEELEAWVKANFEGDQAELAAQRMKEVKTFWRNPEKAKGYPFDYVVSKFTSGVIKRVFLPKGNA